MSTGPVRAAVFLPDLVAASLLVVEEAFRQVRLVACQRALNPT